MENIILEHTKNYNSALSQYYITMNKRIMRELFKNLTRSHVSVKKMLREKNIRGFISHPVLKDLSFLNSKFVPIEIKKTMETEIHYTLKYSFKINTRKITILFYIHSYDEIQIKKYDGYIEKIMILLFFLSTYSKNKCSNHLTIHFCLSSLQKLIPTNVIDVFDVKHVNSAVTTSCVPKGHIFIYRNEEWFKVLIHELFHVMGLDFSYGHSSLFTQKLRDELNIESDYLIYEAYSEFWATIINTMFYTYFTLYFDTKVDNIYIDDFLDMNNQHLNIELTFSLLQSVKILSYMHLNYEMCLETAGKISKFCRWTP